MSDFAKEGKKFLKSLDDYFKEFEKIVGYSMVQHMRSRTSTVNSAPNPIKIIDSLDMFCHTGGEDLTLFIHKRPGFDGFCTFLDNEKKSRMEVFGCLCPIWVLGKSPCCS